MSRIFALTFVFCLASSNYAMSECNPEVCSTNLAAGKRSCVNPGLPGVKAADRPDLYRECIRNVEYRYGTCVKYWCSK
jgi:hypothetical protein